MDEACGVCRIEGGDDSDERFSMGYSGIVNADRVTAFLFTLREFIPSDYDAVLALWRETEGVLLRDADSREAIAAFLARNPGLCFVALILTTWPSRPATGDVESGPRS